MTTRAKSNASLLIVACHHKPWWDVKAKGLYLLILFVTILTITCLSFSLSLSRALEVKRKAVQRIEEQLMKLQVQATDREENKQIALGTSKLNYLDPRISVAWYSASRAKDNYLGSLVVCLWDGSEVGRSTVVNWSFDRLSAENSGIK